MLVGYARISTDNQSLCMQEDALKSSGCQEIFTDVSSGSKSFRPGLDNAFSFLREGDTLVVWKLDRLGRSLPHLIQTIEILNQKKIGFKSLREHRVRLQNGPKSFLRAV
jgi:DNA invertase Pin-like site-specific DNA recombinase